MYLNFLETKQFPGFELIICGKRRGENDSRIVTILDGDCKVGWFVYAGFFLKKNKGRHVCVVDDLVRSGGTLLECGNETLLPFVSFQRFVAAKALLDHGAAGVSFFVVHAEFPQQSWKKFLPGTCPIPIKYFFVTDSCADVTANLEGKVRLRERASSGFVFNFHLRLRFESSALLRI